MYFYYTLFSLGLVKGSKITTVKYNLILYITTVVRNHI